MRRAHRQVPDTGAPRSAARRLLLVAFMTAVAAACAEYVLAPETPTRAPRAVQLSALQMVLNEGQTSQLSATVLDQEGRPFDTLPPGVTLNWTSSDDSIASVGATGAVVANAPGVAQIAVTATGGGVTTASVGASIVVQPVPTALAVAAGDSQLGIVGEVLLDSLRAQVTDRRGNGVPGISVAFAVVTGGGSLSSDSAMTDSSGVAAVRYTLGTVAGPNTIEARATRLPQAVATFSATARPGAATTLVALSGDGQAGQPGAALPVPLVARAADRFDNGVPAVTVTWQVTAGGGTLSDTSVVTDGQGQATVQWTLGAAGQPQTVRADIGGLLIAAFSATAVSSVASVDVTPPTATVTAGGTQQFTATPRDAGGNALTGRAVTWATSDGTIATIDSTGLLTAVAPGPVTVTATVEGVDGTASVTVAAVPVASVDVTPATVTLTAGGTQQFTATPRDAGGNALTNRTVAWSTSDGAIATIDTTGLLTAVAPGPVTVTATVEGVDGTASVTVTAVSVASVDVTPPATTLASGATVQLTATPRDAGGNPLTSRTVTWASSDSPVAGVDGNGLVQAALVGTATITATVEGVDGTASVTVTPGAADRLEFTVQPSATTVGQALSPAVEVTVRDAAGNVVPALPNPVTVAIGTNPSGATLAGTTDQDVANGVATFGDLILDAPGTGYTLTASTLGVTGATSLPFDVVPPLTGANVSWVNAAGGNWNDGSNWSTGTVPGPSDTALITLSGTYTVTDADAVVNVGRLVVGDDGASGGQMTLALSAVTLTAEGGIRVTVGGVLDLTGGSVAGAAGVLNDGTVVLRDFNASPATIATSFANSGNLLVRGLGAITGTLTDNRSLIEIASEAADSAVLTLATGLVVTGDLYLSNLDPAAPRAATLEVSGGTLQIDGETGDFFVEPGTMGGSRTLRAQVLMDNSARVHVDQSLVVDRPSAVHVGSGMLTGGDLTFVQTGTNPTLSGAGFTIDAGRTLVVTGGTFTSTGGLRGTGTLDVSGTSFVRADGDLSPNTFGLPGTFRVVGNLPLGPSAATLIDISGTTPDGEYDQILVSGSATLNGYLQLELMNGFVPAVGDAFTVLTAGSVSGAFPTLYLPTLTTGVWQIDYNATSVVARVVAAGTGGNVSWINAAGGSWSDGTNWSTGSVPGPNDTALITLSGTYTVSAATAAVTVGKLVLGDGGVSGQQTTLAFSNVVLAADSGVLVMDGGVLDLTGGSVASAWGVSDNGTVVLREAGGSAATIAAPMNVLRNLWVRGRAAITGAVATNSSTVIEIASEGADSAVLTVAAGFTNEGQLLLTNRDPAAARAAILAVNGTLLIDGEGELHSEPGTMGGARVLRAELDNRYLARIDHALVVDRPSAAHQNEDALEIAGGDLTFVQSGTNPSFTNRVDLTVSAGRTLTVDGGTFVNTGRLRGAGTVDVSTSAFSAPGLVAPGGAPGAPFGIATLAVVGDVQSMSDVEVELGGTTPGTEYDHVAVTGAVTLSGDLFVSLVNGFEPALGATFDVITAGSVSGMFQNVGLPLLSGGLAWSVDYSATAVTLRVVPAPVASVDVTPTADTIVSGTTVQLTATPRDANGNPLTGRTVTWASSDPTVAAVDGNGLVQAALVGTATITATSEGIDGMASVTVTVGAASQLAFTVQPSTTTAGQAITPAVEVTVRDAAGNVVPTLVDPVTVAIGNNPGGATLGGTTDQDVGSGVATFADLTLDAAGTGYTLVASAPGLTGATSTAFDVAASPTTVSLDIPGEDLVGVGLSTTLDITLGVAAGAGGLTVAVTSDNPSMVSVAAPGSVFVPAGATTGQIVLNGVSVGSTVIRANTPGYAEGTLAVTATNQIISLPTTLNVPYGLTATIPIQLATAAPAGGVTVTLTTDDASHVGVVTSTVTLSQGATLSSGTLSGVAPGPATITATAPGWVTDVTAATTTADLNVVQSSIAINAGFGGSMTVELRSGGSPIAAPSPGVTVALTALNAACVAVPAGVTIPTGFTSTTASVAYASSATTPCASYVRATAPNMTADSVNVSVASAPGIAVNPSTVGAGLQTNGNGSLGASNYGVVTVRVTSSDPGLFLVAPNSTTPGSAFIDLSLTEPTTSINYFVQGMEGQTGTGTVTVTAPGFTDGSATVTVRGVGMDLLSVPTTTTSLSPNSAFQVRIGMLDAAGTTIASEQAIRAGGVPLTATVVNSDATVAQLVTSALTGQSVTVEIGVGQNRSSTNLALGGVQFDPLSSGTTTVSATMPGVTATAGATRTVIVN